MFAAKTSAAQMFAARWRDLSPAVVRGLLTTLFLFAGEQLAVAEPGAKDDASASPGSTSTGDGPEDDAPAADDERSNDGSLSLREQSAEALNSIELGTPHVTAFLNVQSGFEWRSDTPWTTADHDGFNIRRGRIGLAASYPVLEEMSVAAKVEIDFSGSSPKLTDMYASIGAWDNRLQVDFGQQRTAFSLLQNTSSKYQQFAQTRAALPEVIDLSGGRDRGLRLRMRAPLGDEGRADVHMSFTNGDGANDIANQDSRFLFATFVDVAPLGSPGKDQSDLDDSDFVFSFGGSFSYTGGLGNTTFGAVPAETSELRFAAHARFKARGLAFTSEFLRIAQEGVVSDDIIRQGVVAQIGYVLPLDMFPQLELAFRYQYFDLDDSLTGFESYDPVDGNTRDVDLEFSETQIFDVGANLYLVDHRLKFGVVYRHTDVLEGPVSGASVVGEAVFCTLQVGAFSF